MQIRIDFESTDRCPTCAGHGTVTEEQLRGLIEGRPGKVGRSHPETSQRAARRPSNRIRFGTQRWQVLETLRHDGRQTAAEIAAEVGLSRNQTASRLHELREVGFVRCARDSDGQLLLRATGPKDWGQVQEITEAGRRAIAVVKVPCGDLSGDRAGS